MTTSSTLHISTGGAEPTPGQPWTVLIHGAGGNRTQWAFQARYLAGRGHNVAAIDLPGHGRSPGPAQETIAGYADTVAEDLADRGIGRAAIVGHSMGAMIALQLAGTRPDSVSKLALVGAGLKLGVNPDLLTATAADPALAIDAIIDWGHSGDSHLGQSQPPGVWIDGADRAVMLAEAAAHPGSLHADFAATASFDGSSLAGSIDCPVLVVSGARDLMTPPKLGRAVVDAIAGADYVEYPGCGHMIMAERPRELTSSLAAFLAD